MSLGAEFEAAERIRRAVMAVLREEPKLVAPRAEPVFVLAVVEDDSVRCITTAPHDATVALLTLALITANGRPAPADEIH